MLEFRILGPLEVSSDGRTVDIGGPKQRALLAVLLLRAGQPVPRDALIHELWGDLPPPGVQHTLDVYLSRLRKALEAGAGQPVVLTRAAGYSLSVTAAQLDTVRFEQLVADGRSALAEYAHEVAAARLTAALQLWRGPLLAGLSNGYVPHAEVARLEELRIGALEDRVEADLALGKHDQIVGELQALVCAHPLRERLQTQLMLALYRGGRQAEALEAYQAARRKLLSELGLEPGPALRDAQRAILEQDRSLELASGLSKVPRAEPVQLASRDRLGRRLFAAAGALIVVVALVVAMAARRSIDLKAGPDTVGVIDAQHSELTTVVRGVGRPSAVAYGDGAAWVTDSADDTLLRISRSGQVTDHTLVGRGPAGVAVGDGEVWVANALDGTVSEVNAAAATQVATISVGTGPQSIAYSDGSVWVGNVISDSVTRIDAATGKVTATIALSSAPTGLAAGAGAVWVISQQAGELLRVSPSAATASQATSVGQSPVAVTVGDGSVWVADSGGTVLRLNPRTGRRQVIRVGGSPAGLAYAAGAIWVAGSQSGTVTRISQSGQAQAIRLGGEPTQLAAAGGQIWSTVLPSLTSHRGGTLTILSPPIAGHTALPTDLSVAYDLTSWQMLSMTNDGLVGYRHITGLAGDQLVPDLATALPAPADGGRTYTFRLRPGLRYSTGAPVRPADIRRAIERDIVINRHLGLGILPYYADIAGAAACERGSGPCNLDQGIVTDAAASTITFHLRAANPDFLYTLAFPWADAVPPGTPDHQVGAAAIPATGPYMTRSLVPGRTWLLVRNPYFRQWSAQAQPAGYPDRIVLRFNVPAQLAIRDVERGQADVLLSPPPGSIGQLETHYTSQLHSGPLPATVALTLNTRIAPFDKLAARQAINDAIDRAAVIALNGGPLAARPTCQILPPTMAGYLPYCPYTSQPGASGAWTAPDLARARELVRASGTRGDAVTVVASDQGTGFPSVATGRYVVQVLDLLGYRAVLRVTSTQAYYGVLGNSRDRVQAGFIFWSEDYPAPPDFIEPLLSCRSFLPDNPVNLNTAEFCDPRIDGQAAQAQAEESAHPAAAAAAWAAVDRSIVQQAPWVPLYNPISLALLSARVGNYEFHPHWSLLLDQLWVR